MDYMARDPARRLAPAIIDPRLRSVISLAYPYPAPAQPLFTHTDPLRGRIAAYALGPDYHDRVLAAARMVEGTIKNAWPDSTTRVYVDTGPVFEREWAARAGLGWFGRNTNLINVHHGSYFFLSEIFTDLEFDAEPQAYSEHCGRCRRCIELCPTGALIGGRTLDARLCISYLTIEHRGWIPSELRPKLGNWIFGCDICQEVCPWNAPGVPYDELFPWLPGLMELDDSGFARRYGKSAIRRTKRRGLLRNAAVALGNSRDPEAILTLKLGLSGDPEPLVRGHCAWALGEIGSPPARREIENARRHEPDRTVLAEIEAALERSPAGCTGAPAGGNSNQFPAD
jgi:epoxyqueuosine reductase